MRSGSGQARRFNAFTLRVGAPRSKTAADRQLLEQRDGSRQRIQAAFMRERAAKIRDRAD